MSDKTLITPPELQNNVNRRNRIVFIDIAKAICIVLVVIGHYIPSNSPEWYVTLHDIIYSFHMPLFMFASGYVYIATKKDVPYGQFIVKKIRRLMVPYLTTSVIIITIKLVTQGNMSVDNPVTTSSYLRMFFMPEAGYFLWFIWALWWMFVIIPLFKTKRARLLLFVFSFALHYLPLPLPGTFCVAQFKNMLVFFMLGIIAFEYNGVHAFIKGFKVKRAAIIIMLFALAQYLRYENVPQEVIHVIGFLQPYLGILFIVEVSKSWELAIHGNTKSGILLIAASSYIIYLFHTTFEGFTKAIIRKLPLDSDLWYVFLPEALVVIAMGVVGPIICAKAFKRYRLTRYLFGL